VHQGFFPFQFCDVVVSHHTGNHRQEVLAKFGYSSERKVEKFQHPDIFWQSNGTYCDYTKKKSSKSGNFQCIFFTKILCMLQWFLFLLPSGKIRPKIKDFWSPVFSVILGCIPMTGYPLFQWWPSPYFGVNKSSKDMDSLTLWQQD
jgi:hypothetical protein